MIRLFSKTVLCQKRTNYYTYFEFVFSSVLILCQQRIVFSRVLILCQQRIVFSSVVTLCQQRIVCANSASDGTNCENLQANRIVNNIERHYSVDGLQFHVLVKLISFKISKGICNNVERNYSNDLSFCVLAYSTFIKNSICPISKYICPSQQLRAPLFTQ